MCPHNNCLWYSTPGSTQTDTLEDLSSYWVTDQFFRKRGYNVYLHWTEQGEVRYGAFLQLSEIGLHYTQRIQCLLLPCNMLVLTALAKTVSRWAAHNSLVQVQRCRVFWDTHLGRGWTPAEPAWGAPRSDGRQAGAGLSPHWCTRCSHHARRR